MGNTNAHLIPRTPFATTIGDGPEGRSRYCLNLNCRAPPGRFLQPDLMGWWRDVWPNSYVDSTRVGLFRCPHRARVMFSTYELKLCLVLIPT
jgi:hypothetical protein